jgi:cysteine desulfurase
VIIDLDANATYAPSERLQGVIKAAWEHIGNPSSLHRTGQRAKAAIEEARSAIRALVGASANDTVIFTSGATEANNLVVHQARRSSGAVVSSTIEHPCILQPLHALKDEEVDVRFAGPNCDGVISAGEVESLVDANTRLVSIMAANNETGVVNDVQRIASAVRALAPHAVIHSDAAQYFGKLPFSFQHSGLNAITLSGHKFGALSGIGALIVEAGVEFEPLIRGGAQEGKLRGGTENVLGIIALGAVAVEVMRELPQRTESMSTAREIFERTLLAMLSDIEINGSSVSRLPNTSNVFISGVRADDLVVALDLEGMQISSGAACSSGKPEPSHVLSAMGQGEARVRSTVRVSFRADQTPELATTAAERIASVVTRMRTVR